nr:ribonuclease H-like domain-containing protein [Tanacetum cinerariifolium]
MMETDITSPAPTTLVIYCLRALNLRYVKLRNREVGSIHAHLSSLPFNTYFEKEKKTYLLDVGYFRSEDYLKSATLVDTCLEKCCVLILRFAIEESCVLLKKNLAFCSRRIFRLLKEYCVLPKSRSCVLTISSMAFTVLTNVDTRPNGEALRKCILSGPYKPTIVLVHAVEATDNSPTVAEHTTVDMSPENKAHFLAEKEAIHLILTGIGDDIYSTVDACQTAQEMWEAIERLQQGQRSISSITSARMVKYQNEVNELRAEKLARNANLLALVATAQASHDPFYQSSRQFRTQRTVNVTGTREKVGSQVVQKTGFQCFNCKYDWLADTDEEVDEQELKAHYNYMAKIQEVPNANSGTDSEPVEQNEQNDVESDDERVALANLIANLKLDVDENKKIQKQLKKANTTLAQELKECKAILAETSKSLGESIGVRDSSLIALQTKQTEFEKYKAFNDRTVDYDKLERKLNEALGKIAHKDNVIREGLKTKAYELSVVKEKHNELMKQSLLTKSHYEGLVKQKTKVITDLKLKEEHDIEKILSMEKQLKFLNKVVYKRSQSIQTIHMMAPKVSTYNGRPTFANPIYLKQAQSEIPCLHAFPYDQNTHANRLILDGEETLALERESRSKLNKDSVRPYDYTKLNSLYEIFKPPTQEYETQLAHTNEIRRKMWRKSFVKPKPNIYKNVAFLPVSKSISKSRKAYNVMTNNINHFNQICDDAWTKHSKDMFRAQTALDMEILIQTCLMPLAIKTQDMYDVILHDCISKDVMCSYLQSLSDLDALAKLQCMYLHKVKECDCLAQKLSNQTESVRKEVHTELLKRFAILEKHPVSLELDLQKRNEQAKNDTVWNEKASNGFRKEREQYIKIQDLDAKLKDKNIAISELKKLTEKSNRKYVDTKFDRPSVVRQPNAQRIPKPLVLGKPTPFSDSLERKYFPKTRSVPKTNVSEGLSKLVTAQNLPQTAKKAGSNTNVLRP